MSSQSLAIEQIRSHSRRLVREFGYLEQTVADSDLSGSAVHAIVEIAARPPMTAKQLSHLLLLEKSTVSRMLRGLIGKGLLCATPMPDDGRSKGLMLTDQGHRMLARIETHAVAQVEQALTTTPRAQTKAIETGLGLYADALARARQGRSETMHAQVREGYVPGLCGLIIKLHAQYYSTLVGFGLPFETKVAADMAEFLSRVESPANATWYVEKAGCVVGGVSIDGEDLGDNIAHLRWFILDDAMRGSGLGNGLMRAAVEFCRGRRFDEVHLWTFRGLDAARRLYEKYGFSLVEEQQGDQWGRVVSEQKYVCRLKR